MNPAERNLKPRSSGDEDNEVDSMPPQPPAPKRKHYAALPAAGLSVLSVPDKPTVDIVFVHGFTGHPERTWRHKGGSLASDDHDRDTERPPKTRKITEAIRKYTQKNENPTGGGCGIFWPRDLLPKTLPYARVLTFGYETHLRHHLQGGPNQSTLYEIANDFLVALEAERRSDSTRPVAFVAHSLGGILVKEMLRQARVHEQRHLHLHAILEATEGIIFFGTPHSGSDPRGFLRRIAENVAKTVGYSVNDSILSTLLPTSERLKELRDEFGPLAERQGWKIHSFQEGLGVRALGNQKVVDPASSSLNLPAIEVTEHIGRNHMEMCRFAGPEDIEYKKFVAAMIRIVPSHEFQNRLQESSIVALTGEQRKQLLQSLEFDQMDARKMSVEKAHAKTCGWLLKAPQYLDWLDLSKLDQHQGFLWLKGNPGTGKSMLMKFITEYPTGKKLLKNKTVISFFFNARGTDLEKSTIGMYRSLLLQLCEKLPQVKSAFDTQWHKRRVATDYLWTIESLKHFFEQAILRLGQSTVACFVDALDECPEDEIRDMVAFFQTLGNVDPTIQILPRFQVFFASRHYPYITAKGLSLDLDAQEGHHHDIENYIQTELKLGTTRAEDHIRARLREKANGIFMWVSLVVGMLNKESDQGQPVGRLQKTLDSLPSDLHALFRDILVRGFPKEGVNKGENKGELLLCLQWLLFSRQPLEPRELYCAILSGTHIEDLVDSADSVSEDSIRKFLLHCSKGLAEVTKGKIATVQFIHESVRDFLLKANGLEEIMSDIGPNLSGRCHNQLKHCCLSYLQTPQCRSYLEMNSDDKIPRLSDPARRKALSARTREDFPFLTYVTDNVLFHADLAEREGAPQGIFLETFPFEVWRLAHNILEKASTRQYSRLVNLLYVLAEYNAAALIKLHPNRNGPFFSTALGRHGPPLFAAFVAQSLDAAQVIIDIQMENLASNSPYYALCKSFAQNRNKWPKVTRDFTVSLDKHKKSTFLEHYDSHFWAFCLAVGLGNESSKSRLARWILPGAAGSGSELIVTNCLNSGSSVNGYPKDHIPLSQASSNGHEAVVKLLLDHGANIESKDTGGMTPLSWASLNGHEAVVKLLLDHGADTESKDTGGMTPLSWASIYGHEAVFKLLLDHGADTESKDTRGMTPLFRASLNGHKAVVKLLLDYGADIESKDSGGMTPLFRASLKGYKAGVKLLLDYGADIESKDNGGMTPLSQASLCGYEAVVKLLLDHGNKKSVGA